MRHVLAAVDHSEPSRWGARVAAALAGRFGADLRLVYVLDPEADARPADTGELVREGEQFVADFPAPALGPGTRLDRVFRIGPTVEEILAAAEDWSADLIVAGTHGRHGVERWVLGSTAEAILRRATCPVLCVGHEPRDPTTFGRIVVAADQSPQAAWATAAAARFGRALGASVTLVHAVPFAEPIDPNYPVVSDEADDALRNAGTAFLAGIPWPDDQPQPERQVRQGRTVEEILEAASDWNADLIFLGTHGRHGLPRLLLGSTAEAVVRRAPCPVLCFSHPPRDAAEAAALNGG